MNIEMGAKYRDVITGVEGIAIGFTTYMTGCNQVLLARPPDEKGEWRDSLWFDEERMDQVGGDVVELIAKPDANGVRPTGPDRPAPLK